MFYDTIPGIRGLPGISAPAGKPPPHRGFFFTYHSQTEMVPPCPKHTTQMWTGYSLLHFMGDSKSHGQDLGNIFFNILLYFYECIFHNYLSTYELFTHKIIKNLFLTILFESIFLLNIFSIWCWIFPVNFHQITLLNMVHYEQMMLASVHCLHYFTTQLKFLVVIHWLQL